MEKTEQTLNLEGIYKLDQDSLIGDNITLKIGQRHRPKKGQAKRFIGAIDTTKPEIEQYSYISSLYSKQSTRNTYTLDYKKQTYELSITDISSVVIKKAEKEPVLAFIGSLEGRA